MRTEAREAVVELLGDEVELRVGGVPKPVPGGCSAEKDRMS